MDRRPHLTALEPLAAPEDQFAGTYNECRDLLRSIGTAWLEVGLLADPAQQYNLARECERKSIDLSDAFHRLALAAEEKELRL